MSFSCKMDTQKLILILLFQTFLMSYTLSFEYDQNLNIYDLNLTVNFDPYKVEQLHEDEEVNVYFNFTPCCSSVGLNIHLKIDDSVVAEITENSTISITDDMLVTGLAYGSFTVRGKRLGLAKIKFYVHENDTCDVEDDDYEDCAYVAYDGYEVIVIRERKLKDDIYRYGIIIFASIIYFGFGCQINLSTIWKICKKPIAPIIGIVCQFLVMPSLGFGVAKLLRLDDVYAFGLLAMSCSPGGGGSNTWAYLLEGDLDLSITMTFFSTLFSLFFMPFWMWALGRFFIDSSRVTIPYTAIARTLLTLVVPLLVGLIIRRFSKKLADFLVKITKPVTLIFIIFMLTYGVWVNWYMYVIMGTVPEVIPAAILLPWFGFFLGWLIAFFVARLKKKQAITVGIETGYQNPSIPIVMLQGNFVQPEGDLGAVMPVATALFTPIPLYFWYIYIEIRNRRCPAAKDYDNNEVDTHDRIDKNGNEIEAKTSQSDASADHVMENGGISTQGQGSNSLYLKDMKQNGIENDGYLSSEVSDNKSYHFN